MRTQLETVYRPPHMGAGHNLLLLKACPVAQLHLPFHYRQDTVTRLEAMLQQREEEVRLALTMQQSSPGSQVKLAKC